jgi:hypothetical protein
MHRVGFLPRSNNMNLNLDFAGGPGGQAGRPH